MLCCVVTIKQASACSNDRNDEMQDIGPLLVLMVLVLFAGDPLLSRNDGIRLLLLVVIDIAGGPSHYC